MVNRCRRGTVADRARGSVLMSLTVGSQQQVTIPLRQFYYVALLAWGKALAVLPAQWIQPDLRNRPAFPDVHVGWLVGTF
jgi:hypothetical protein